ncbi:unnamed protein product [Rotaria socialis]|uniref:EGF-like domain-containing protein n=3 Tax=Rotaria socialis TaxID=392032 RepID=A0A818J9I1_9BILA|nr:unnamed protein product [Rotaria socialis]CAF3532402.1 unnamed protein product [Rotaria socialis]CAF4647330.1 unnamed protein product [Rotaria socialis]
MIHHHSYPSVSTLIIILFLSSLQLIQSNSISNECLDYCSNDGLCIETNNGLQCICLPEWTGHRCDSPRDSSLTKQMYNSQVDMTFVRSNPCDSAPAGYCKNTGICFVEGVAFKCFCPYPYTGEYCEDLSDCFDYCLNNGICKLESNTPKCVCSLPWTGNRCQKLEATTTVATQSTPSTTNIPCTYVPPGYCNSGTCIAVNNQARCQCPPEFLGLQCEIPRGATPSQTPSTVTLSTFTTPTFTTPTSTMTTPTTRITCTPNPCRNNRPCYNNGNSYFCYCGQQYTGKNCENLIK